MKRELLIANSVDPHDLTASKNQYVQKLKNTTEILFY